MMIYEGQMRKVGERFCLHRFEGPREVQSTLCPYEFVNFIHHPEGELLDKIKDTKLYLNQIDNE